MSYNTLEDVQFARELLSPPGDTLLETIESYNISQADLAARMGRPIKTINEIVKGKTAITPETAIQLERVLKIPATFWLNREANYQMELAEIADAENLLIQKDWLKNFPLNEMKKFGWIDFENSIISKMESIFSFLCVSSIEGFDRVYGQKLQTANYRIDSRGKHNNYAIAAWLRKGELQSLDLPVKEYSPLLFKETLKTIKSIAASQPDDFFIQLQLLCAEAGVKVVHTPCLPGATLHGSTRWVGDNPVIQLSNRYQRNDIFWFTFFHEAGHILKHGKKALFIEGLEYTDEAKEKEKEADEIAIEYTLTYQQEAELRANLPLNKDSILFFANEFNTHPACIIGRFARKNPKLNILGWKYGYFQKIEFS